MKTTTFITKYEGPKKVYVEAHYPLVAIISSLGVNITQEQCELILENLKKAIAKIGPHTDVFTFKKLLSNTARELDGAFVYVTPQNEAMCVTQGTGMVFLRRNNQVKMVVADGSFAKGLAKASDEFIVTTSEYLDFVGGLEGFKYYFGKYLVKDVSEMMETYEDQSSPSGFVAMYIGKDVEEEDEEPIFVEGSKAQEGHAIEGVEQIDTQVSHEIHKTSGADNELIEDIVTQAKLPKKQLQLFAVLRNILKRENIHKLKQVAKKALSLFFVLRSLGPKKLISLFIFIVLLFFAVRSIPFGEMFKNRDAEYAKVESKVNGYLDEAEVLAFESMSEVATTLQKARDELEVMSEADKRHFASKIALSNKAIDEKETKLLKISNDKLEEYYSFSLLGKDVTVTDADTDVKNIYILDGDSGSYHKITTDKRSQNTIKSDKLKGALQISAYEGLVYVLTKSDGVYRLADDKSVQVLKPEESWGQLTDMKIFAGNIYLLDSKNGDIYKYPGVDADTFGNKTPYLVEEARGTLTGAVQMTISGPVYVVGGDKIAKYSIGRKQDFFLKTPYVDGSIDEFASLPQDLGFFVFDKKYGAVYEHNEDTIFAKQYRDQAIKNTKKILVTENGVFLLTSESIFKLP